jgi:hypothetical protein
MILNAYAVLDAFVSLLRLLLGVLVLGLGGVALRKWWAPLSPEGRSVVEERGYLLFMLAVVLLGLDLASWPLFYLLLQSYIPQWPGVMCIYGVTRIGAGTVGISRFLPSLVTGLELAKPALVFVGGAWFVVYRINRRTAAGSLLGRTLCILMVFGLVAVTDATAELAYLVIPKQEEYLASGCCAQAFDADAPADKFLPTSLAGESSRPRLYAAYYGMNLGMVLALFAATCRPRSRLTRSGLASLLAGGVLNLLVSLVFLIEIAAPRLLHLPYHHCPYDLIPSVPESLVAMGLFVLGTFAVGWAFVAAWWADSPDTRPIVREGVRYLLRLGLFGYLGSVLMMSVELALA